MKNRISLVIIFVVFGFTQSIGQNLDLDYVKNWLIYSNAEYKPELVRDFFINGEYNKLDNASEFNKGLKKIKIADINSISYSSVNTCDYSSGKGEIYILSKTKRTQADIKQLIKFGTEIYDDEKPMILVVNNSIQPEITFSKLIAEFDISKIYDIGISRSPVPKAIYGINAENGIIKIWTE